MNGPELKRLSWTVATVAAAAALIFQTGCLTGPQFRQAALPSVQTGVESILDGIVEGIFAAIEVESTADTDSTS